jgi:TonB family protein
MPRPNILPALAGAFFYVVSISAVAQAGQVPVYPNTIAGLQQQIADIVDAQRQNNGPRVEMLVDNLLVPKDEQWASANLSEHARSEFIAKYRAASKVFEARILAETRRVSGSPNGVVAVANYPIPTRIPEDTRRLLTAPPALQCRIEFSGGGLESKFLVDTFLYYKDAFRFVGHGIFAFWIPIPPGFSADGNQATHPKVIYDPDPVYPEDARKNRIQGTVVVSITVGADGLPHNLVAKKGDPALRAAALEAVSHWKFAPATADGEPVHGAARGVR